jgi:uncharacterized protein (TIGR02646 family)
VPEVLTAPKGPAAREREASHKHFSTVVPNRPPFKFKVYGHKTIREALEALFEGKCAYCETRYSIVHPVDVEHWRPKSEVVVDGVTEPVRGYYWLASRWENLFPSCIDCNRVRTHTIMPGGEVLTVGKGNRFPIADETARAGQEGDESLEVPLLLNPYRDDPANHLEFLEEGVVRARADAAGQPSALGEASIGVYALNRFNLVVERREVLLQIHQRIHAIRALTRVLDTSGDPAVADIVEELIEHEMRALQRFELSDRPYTLMARQVIAEHMDDLLAAETVTRRRGA